MLAASCKLISCNNVIHVLFLEWSIDLLRFFKNKSYYVLLSLYLLMQRKAKDQSINISVTTPFSVLHCSRFFLLSVAKMRLFLLVFSLSKITTCDHLALQHSCIFKPRQDFIFHLTMKCVSCQNISFHDTLRSCVLVQCHIRSWNRHPFHFDNILNPIQSTLFIKHILKQHLNKHKGYRNAVH